MTSTARLALWPLAAAGAGAAAAALGVGISVLVANTVDSGSAWTDLAVVLLGMMASVGLGVVVWLGFLVAAARRLFPLGERLTPVLLSAGAVLAVVVLVSVVSGAGAESSGADPLVVLVTAAVAIAVLPSAVFVLRGRTVPRPGPPPGWPLPPA